MFFCWRCGKECSDGANFCGHCGNHFFSMVEKITKKEYFENHCSPNAKKRQLTIKILSYVIMAIQLLLFTLLVLALAYFFIAALSFDQMGSSSDFLPFLFGNFFSFLFGVFVFAVLLLLATIAGGFFFLLFGLRKNRTGFFITATVLNFFPLWISSNSLKEGSFLLPLILLALLSAHILIIIFSYKNNKEYKAYIKNLQPVILPS